MADFSRVRANDYAIFYVQTSKGKEDVGRNLIQEAQADPSATSGARDLERAFANHETVTYSYQAERGTGSVCLREVPQNVLPCLDQMVSSWLMERLPADDP